MISNNKIYLNLLSANITYIPFVEKEKVYCSLGFPLQSLLLITGCLEISKIKALWIYADPGQTNPGEGRGVVLGSVWPLPTLPTTPGGKDDSVLTCCLWRVPTFFFF